MSQCVEPITANTNVTALALWQIMILEKRVESEIIFAHFKIKIEFRNIKQIIMSSVDDITIQSNLIKHIFLKIPASRYT